MAWLGAGEALPLVLSFFASLCQEGDVLSAVELARLPVALRLAAVAAAK